MWLFQSFMLYVHFLMLQLSFTLVYLKGRINVGIINGIIVDKGYKS